MIFSNFSLLSQKNGLLLQRSQKPIGNYPVEQRFLCSSVMVGIFLYPYTNTYRRLSVLRKI